MNFDKQYYAKLMLAGEYGVIAGSEAVTVPLEKFHAKLASGKNPKKENIEVINASVTSLRKLVTYINELPKNSFYAKPENKLLENMLKDGCYIHSNIPGGYGIGSSGAVSALIYDQFFGSVGDLSMEQKRKDLATIESCFHGRSSGVDAMSCYYNQPLHFMPDGDIRKISVDPLQLPLGYKFFLLDSKQIFETGPLVKIFLEKMKNADFERLITEDYFELIRKFIKSVLSDQQVDPALIFRVISDFQYNHFKPMIPENIVDIWIDGQVNNLYYLKLNGSGGGYVLGITHDDNKAIVIDMLKDFELIWL